MPHFQIVTNVPADKIPDNFLTETTALISKILGKDRNYCVATVVPNAMMAWGDNPTGPCGTATLMSIGKLGVEENKKHAAALHSHCEKYLGIPKDRLYIIFNDATPDVIGHNGTTFHGIL